MRHNVHIQMNRREATYNGVGKGEMDRRPWRIYQGTNLIYLVLWPEYSRPAKPISRLLMPWFFVFQSHQYPWYELCGINIIENPVNYCCTLNAFLMHSWQYMSMASHISYVIRELTSKCHFTNYNYVINGVSCKAFAESMQWTSFNLSKFDIWIEMKPHVILHVLKGLGI